MSLSPFRARRGPAAERTAEIKAWVGEAFSLPEEATVMVTELQCREPGCPPLETVIAILDGSGPPRQHKLHKATAEVSREDVAALAARAR